MTSAILCDGCETWETVDVFSHVLEITDTSGDHEEHHLCKECTKMFWKWVEQIPKSEDT